MDKVTLGFKRLHKDAKIPAYAHDGDAGMDVFALEDETLPLDIPVKVRTGVAAEIPAGYELQVRPRSGLACKGVTVWNSPGTVDPNYRGEIMVPLMYINNEVVVVNDEHGNGIGTHRKSMYHIHKGDRIAQLVLSKLDFADPVEIMELSETNRGSDGFGSTGQ